MFTVRQSVLRIRHLLLLVTLPALVACSAGGQGFPTPTPWPTPIVAEKPVYRVQRGTVIDRFTLSGQIVPVTWQTLSFAVDGRLASLTVTEGSQAQQGDLLGELETRTIADQLAQAQLSLEQAQDQLAQQETTQRFALERARLNLQTQELTLEKLRRSQTQDRPLQLAQAETDLERARLNLEKAQAAYDAIAWRPGAAASSQAAALQSATLEYQAAEARYKLQVQGDSETQIAQQEIQVKLARLALDELEARKDPSLERNVAKAQIQVDALQRQIEERRLHAPFAGQVVAVGLRVQGPTGGGFSTRPKVGDAIPAFAPLIVIAKPEPQEIVVPADRERAGELTVGQPVTVTHSLARERPFAAEVVALPVTTLAGGAEPTGPAMIRISLPKGAPKMAIGDPVEIEVVTQAHEATLFLPPAAIRRFGGRSFVVIEESGRQRRVDIRTGLQNDTRVEILSGLQEGDTVVGQ